LPLRERHALPRAAEVSVIGAKFPNPFIADIDFWQAVLSHQRVQRYLKGVWAKPLVTEIDTNVCIAIPYARVS
jgi:hypothetical protein